MRATLALNGLNEKFYPQMTTIMAFFLQISALFSNFCKIAGENSPPPPIVTHLLSVYPNNLNTALKRVEKTQF